MKRITAAAAAFVLMCQPVSVSALSSTSHGYGQGTQTDSSNCPLGSKCDPDSEIKLLWFAYNFKFSVL